VVIGVAAAFTAGRRPAARSHASGSSKPWRQSVLVAFMVALLVASGVLTTTLMAPRVQHTQAEDYVREVTTGLAAAPGVPVFGVQVPTEVSLSVSLPSLLNAVWREQALALPGAHPRLVTPTGRLVPAGLGAPDLVTSGPERGCGWTLDADPRELLVLSDPGEGERLLRIRYVTADPGILHLEIDGVEQAVRYHRGLGETYFGVTGEVGPVRAWVTRSIAGGDAGMCLTDVARGGPVPLG
jgi:hypothetical protein